MKYTKEQIESHFKWAANNEAPMPNKWIDWCSKSIFIMQDLLAENATLKQQVEVAVEYFSRIDGSRLDWFSTSCIAKEVIAKIKELGVVK